MVCLEYRVSLGCVVVHSGHAQNDMQLGNACNKRGRKRCGLPWAVSRFLAPRACVLCVS